MIQIIVVMGFALAASWFGIYTQWQRNGVLKERLETAQEELDRAETEKKTAADATRDHLRTIDRLNREVTRSNRGVASVKDDECIDRAVSPSVRHVLDFGLHDNPGGASSAPPAGRGKSRLDVRR